MGVKRREPPSLFIHETLLGTAEILRSFPTGKTDVIRQYRNDELTLNVEFVDIDGLPVQVVLHTNLCDPTGGGWSELDFERIQDGHFSITITPEFCGLFKFKVKYSLDGGETWNWDRGAYSVVLVDPEHLKNTRMYTFIPTTSGKISDWKKELYRIKELGFNTVHLLPLTLMDLSESPYAAHKLFEIDKSYLDPDDKRDGLTQFEDFIELAISLDIRLCFDLVLNHVGIDSEIVRLRPGWLIHDNNSPDGLKRAGCWHKNTWIKWEDLTLIDYSHPDRQQRDELWDYMTEYALFWACYAEQTNGMVRFDNLHSSNKAFITELTSVLLRTYPSVGIIAEFFTDQTTLNMSVPEWNLNLLLANQWEYPYVPQLRDYFSFIHQENFKHHYLLALSTHDTDSPVQLFGGEKAIIPRYAATAFFGTGKTAIVQGVEFAAKQKLKFIGRNIPKQYEVSVDFSGELRKINDILDDYTEIFNSDSLTFIGENHGAVLVAFRTISGAGMGLIAAVNLDTANSYELRLNISEYRIASESVEEFFMYGKVEYSLDDNRLKLEMPACGVLLLKVLQK